MGLSRQDLEAKRLIREINKLFYQSEEPDELSLARIRRGALSLRAHNGHAANLVLARIAALLGREGPMRTSHQLIINAIGHHPEVHKDYSESLRKLGFYSEARDSALLAHRRDPENTDYLQLLIKASIVAGCFQQAWEAFDKAIKANARVMTSQFNFLMASRKFLLGVAIDDSQLEAVQILAMGLLRRAGLFPWGVLRSPAVHMELMAGEKPPEGDALGGEHGLLLWEVQVPVLSAEVVGRLNDDLFEAIQSSPLLDQVKSRIRFRYVPRGRRPMLNTGFHY
ncbi:MAG: hypothetical protein HQL64_09415 [Magnetococcales bacterium]|nr:hypothetical protein [Magnetococcales bacterium]